MQMPYKSAILQPIANVKISIDREILPELLSALESVVRFDTELKAKSIAMPSILLRSESSSSSQIEYLTASSKNIGIAELGGKTKDNANLVATNIRAMKEALEISGKLTSKSILNIHKILLGETDKFAGKFREQQVWIGGRMASPHDAKYVPPFHEHVADYISDFLEFVNRDDIHPLVLTAIAHAHFETIHPFTDGNGRTGRAIIQILLRNKGIIRTSTLPISAGFLGRPKEYFKALEAYREGNFNAILEELLIGISLAMEASWETLERIEGLRNKWQGQIKFRRGSAVEKMLDKLLEQPIINANYVSRELKVSDNSARAAIESLMNSGIIRRIKDQKRNVMYQAGEVTEIMDNFGDSIIRRRH
jgi:Fic family protein